MTSRLVNNTGTVLPSNVFTEANPPSEHMWVLKKLNTTYPNLFTQHQETAPSSATASPDINRNLFHKFLLDLKLPGISPAPVITTGPTEPII